MRYISQVLAIFAIACIALPFMNAEEINEPNDAIAETPNAMSSKRNRNGKDTHSDNLSSLAMKEAKRLHRAQHRIEKLLSKVLPATEINLLKFVNNYLEQIIVEMREICERIERQEVPPTPFFDCGVFLNLNEDADGIVPDDEHEMPEDEEPKPKSTSAWSKPKSNRNKEPDESDEAE